MNIHPTAIISDNARLGANVKIGAYAVIEAETEIGDDTEIRAHAVIKRFTTLGAANVVHEGAIIGGEPQDLSFTNAETYLDIGSRNRIREGVTIHRAASPGAVTRIGSDCFLMAYSHVAHDCQIGDRIII